MLNVKLLRALGLIPRQAPRKVYIIFKNGSQKLRCTLDILSQNVKTKSQDDGKTYGLYINLILVQSAYKKIPPGFGRIELSEGKSKRTY